MEMTTWLRLIAIGKRGSFKNFLEKMEMIDRLLYGPERTPVEIEP